MQFTNCSQPLVLATASDWVASGKVVTSAIYDIKKEGSYVELMTPEKIGSFARGLVKDDPIDVYDDSDKDELKVDKKKLSIKKEKSYDVFSVDGLDSDLESCCLDFSN